jgi:CRISPR system Cascade subunit CasB
MTQNAAMEPRIAPLVESLDKLTGPARGAALARLRRALGKEPGEANEAHRYVARFVPERGDDWRERCLYLIAALYAAHPPARSGEGLQQPEDENFGRSCARLVEQDRDRRESVERRFVALLAADEEEIAQRLRQMVQLLAAAKSPVPVNYSRLLSDLTFWQANEHRARRHWAQAFWRVASSDVDTAPNPDTDDTTATTGDAEE